MITGGIASASTFNNNNNDFPDRTFNNNNDQFMGSTNNNNNNRFPGTTNNNNNNGFPGSITNNNNNGFPGGSINNNNNGFPGSGSITNNNGFPNSPPNNNNGFPQGSFTNNNNNGLHWSGTNNDNNIDNSTGIDNTTGALLSESGSSGNSPTSTILGPPSSFPNNRCPFGQLINNNNGDKQVLCLGKNLNMHILSHYIFLISRSLIFINSHVFQPKESNQSQTIIITVTEKYLDTDSCRKNLQCIHFSKLLRTNCLIKNYYEFLMGLGIIENQ